MNGKINSRGGFALALVVIAILSFLAIYLQMQNNKTKLVLNSTYDKSFFELVEYINNMETLLAKAQISNTPEYSAKNLTEIWRQANLAESALGQIPITHTTLTNTLKFINQVGDYSYSLSRKTIENNKLSDEDFSNLQMLYTRCNELNILLGELASDLSAQSLSWDELRKEENNALFAQEVANISQDSFGNIEKGLQDYEGLIYDGPFSEHMTSPEPKGLANEEYSEEQLKEKVYEFVDRSAITEVIYEGVVDGTITAHRFNVKLKMGNDIVLDFTKMRWASALDEL
ncbi:MAG: germination protein YpeB [Clostridia bacterium]|nr:germination protein YpeB [Clostridia bacterium]